MFTEFCETSYSNALGSQLELLGHLGIVYHFKDNHLNQKLYCARLFIKRFFENCIAESPKKTGLRSDEILQYTYRYLLPFETMQVKGANLSTSDDN